LEPESKNSTKEIVISDTKYHLSNAVQVFYSMNTQLPEIRDVISHKQIHQGAIAANITKITTGIS
jgi:hypothetical protein